MASCIKIVAGSICRLPIEVAAAPLIKRGPGHWRKMSRLSVSFLRRVFIAFLVRYKAGDFVVGSRVLSNRIPFLAVPVLTVF